MFGVEKKIFQFFQKVFIQIMDASDEVVKSVQEDVKTPELVEVNLLNDLVRHVWIDKVKKLVDPWMNVV